VCAPILLSVATTALLGTSNVHYPAKPTRPRVYSGSGMGDYERLAPAAVLIDPTFAPTHRLSPRGSHRWPARSATGGKALVLTVQRQPTHTESVSGLEATSGYCACNGGRCTTCVGSHNCSRLWICADHTLSTPETAQLEAHNHLSRHRRQSHACQYTALFRSFVQKRLLF
jgi:hypothetical protein